MAGPLRVLVAHNSYRMRGGEDAVVDAEVALLREHGHTVTEYRRHNDELQDMRSLDAAVDTFWSRRTGRDMDSLMAAARPDVVHVHNTFALISPSLYWAAHRHGIPVVQTLHNFRLLCPQAMFLRDGKVCEDCLGHLPWRAVKHACYRESRTQSAALAGMLVLHRTLGTWQHKVARYIALNDFCRNKFIEGGLPAERIAVKPNFVDFQKPVERARSGFVYVGRLSHEKGIAVLAAAVKEVTGARLSVSGSGPSHDLLIGIDGVELMGARSREDVAHSMQAASALVFPSICFETFGLVIVEAFANATPVIASRIGVVPELVEDGVTGLLFTAGDAHDLSHKLIWAQANPAKMAEMGRNALARFEEKYTPERNYTQLMKIYKDAIIEAALESRQ